MLSRCHAVSLVSEAPALFGKKHTIPVFTLQRTEELLLLHKKLYAALSKISATHIEPLYVGDGYRPHVTTHGDRAFSVGSRKVAEDVWLFKAQNVEKLTGKKAIAKITCAP